MKNTREMQRMKVVTPNYRDRTDKKNRWLTRGGTEHPDNAQKHQALVASMVVFGPSTKEELTFGCGTVAYAQEVAAWDGVLPENAVKVLFDGIYFHTADDNTHVPYCQQLFLGNDGAVHAVLEAATETVTPIGSARTRELQNV